MSADSCDAHGHVRLSRAGTSTGRVAPNKAGGDVFAPKMAAGYHDIKPARERSRSACIGGDMASGISGPKHACVH
eukprot:10717827-Alexandrium_andersonii.AAC.1